MNDVHEMQLARHDLNGLVVLDTLLQTRSVTRTARQLGLSPSATSHALGRLRRTFGDPLLVRGPGGLVPTARGLALAGPLRSALVAVSQAVESPKPFDPTTAARRFVCSTVDFVEFLLWPALAAHLMRHAPGLDLISHVMVEDIASALASGAYDLCIAPSRNAPDQVSIRQRLLFEERFVCLMRRGHPVLDRRLTPKRFAALEHALVSPLGRTGGVVDAALSELGLTRRVRMLTQHFLVAPFVVARTDLVLTMPERTAREMARHVDLEIVSPPIELPTFQIVMLWHERSHDDPAHAWLRDALAEVAAGSAPTASKRRRSR
jgi:DNA-binding transcriptional LysR family regulator